MRMSVTVVCMSVMEGVCLMMIVMMVVVMMMVRVMCVMVDMRMSTTAY